jgi:hypothetical protein
MCGIELSKEELHDCADAIDAASRETQTDVGKKTLQCADTSRSCSEAVGCAAGVGVNVIGRLADQFKTGFERGLSGAQKSERGEPRTPPMGGERSEVHREIHTERHTEFRNEVSTHVSSEVRIGAGPDERSTGRAEVRYLSVRARPGSDDFGNHLIVSMDLEVLTDMALVAPHVKVDALCGGQTDSTNAFFMGLSKARSTDRKADTITLFKSGLPAPPDRCELTLSLSEGSTGPEHFCLLQGATVPGRCP